MPVRRIESGDIVTLRLEGSFFGDAETDTLQKAILDEAETGNARLILDLSECRRINSIAIGVLMRGYARYRGKGGEIKLCSMGREVQELLTATRLLKVFDHHASHEEAVAAFAVRA